MCTACIVDSGLFLNLTTLTYIDTSYITVFHQNLTSVRFYKALFDVAAIYHQVDFKGGIYRDQHARMYIHVASITRAL